MGLGGLGVVCWHCGYFWLRVDVMFDCGIVILFLLFLLLGVGLG